jgi:hypothetical protein
LILADGTEADSADRATVRPDELLRRLLESCRLIAPAPAPSPPSGDTGAEAESPMNSQKAELGEGLSILLVDDQAEQGWADWVEKSLPSAEHKFLSHPDKLVEAINSASTATGSKDSRFRLQLPEIGEATCPVLLLDLRLFSGKFKDELKFYQEKLLSLVDQFTEKGNTANADRSEANADEPSYAWPRFTDADKAFTDALKAVKDGTLKVDTAEHREALTWLPRLLALVDMSIPIILFSSTGRRDLTEHFKPFESIITKFEKPRLSDLASIAETEVASDVRATTLFSLREAIADARGWLVHREQLAQWVKANDANSHVRSTRFIPSLPYHAVLYVDETGSRPNLTFGGLIVIYDGPDGEKRLDTELSRQFGRNIRSHQGKNWLRDNCGNVFRQLAAGVAVPPLFFRLSGGSDAFFYTDLDDSDELHDENVGDNLWRQMLRQVFEAAIYVLARRGVAPQTVTEFSFRAPTRVDRPPNNTIRDALWSRWGISCERVGNDAGVEDSVETLSREWNFRNGFNVWWKDFIDLPQLLSTILPRRPSDERLRFFNYSDARPIAEEVMKLYRSATFKPRANLVRAFSANAHSGPQGAAIPIQHFLVDALLDVRNRNIPGSTAINDEYGLGFEVALETNRLLLSGHLEEAIACQLRVAAPEPHCEVQVAVFRDLLAQMDSKLSGGGLGRISALSRAKRVETRGHSVLTGRVVLHGSSRMPHVKTGDGTIYFIVPPSRQEPRIPAVGAEVKFLLQRDRAPGKPFVARIVTS